MPRFPATRPGHGWRFTGKLLYEESLCKEDIADARRQPNRWIALCESRGDGTVTRAVGKALAMDALIESGVAHFSQDGYYGSSLRTIAADAGVPLSAIHFYFGSKHEMFNAITRKVWREIAAERHLELQQAADRSPTGAPTLEDVVHALAYPVVRRTLAGTPAERNYIRVMREGVIDRAGRIDDGDQKTRMSRLTWIGVLRQAAPELTEREAVWAYSFIIGSIYSYQLADGLYDSLSNAGDTSDTVESVTSDVVDFCCGGVAALRCRRSRSQVP